MAAYLIADVDVIDPAAYEEYKQKVAATSSPFGARYLTRAGATVVLEGDWVPKRLVVLEFPSAEHIKAWYDSPEYRPLKELRQRTARSIMLIAEGIEAGEPKKKEA
ncbi:MAG: D-fructose-6-phosphate amidotransferase [Betaproteobacteria bacterium RBG_16_64_9]|nr:MAG: D-fructose-6-phosphate amidotransferase [Betaproteobacteria bacterium RBG_16_64_9]OGA28316.1 MAG: D-fructose-6-phosphate amidotransferase [Betaproteobacteria bacterium RIFCSPLOWO2_02_FULL_65_24]